MACIYGMIIRKAILYKNTYTSKLEDPWSPPKESNYLLVWNAKSKKIEEAYFSEVDSLFLSYWYNW